MMIKKITNTDLMDVIDKIMETQAYLEFLDEQLGKHLSTETREKYTRQLKSAKNRLRKLNKKETEIMSKLGDTNV
jgi:ATP-dependent exoDNAse (exonuclease V) beta subunit